MIKPEFGTKRVCVSCAAHFYDMTRAPVVCPKCSTEQPPPKPRSFSPPRGMGRSRYSTASTPAVAVEAENEADVIEDADETEGDEPVEDAAEVDEVATEEI